MEPQSYSEIIQRASEKKSTVISVAAAGDKDILLAVKVAHEKKIAKSILIGNSSTINSLAKEIDLDLTDHKVIDIPDDTLAAREAVRQIRLGSAQILMKGLINTSTFMKAMLDKESGLHIESLISYLSLFEIPDFERLLFVTDPGINISPDYMQKVDILNNAVRFMQKLGYMQPKTALLSANEYVSAKMPSTEDAAIICKMAQLGQIKGAIVDGPLSLDLAISKESLQHKGVNSVLNGEAQLLLTPNIEAGNILVKSLTYFAKGTMSGVVLGTNIPIVMTSRSDSPKSKLVSIALACLGWQ